MPVPFRSPPLLTALLCTLPAACTALPDASPGASVAQTIETAPARPAIDWDALRIALANELGTIPDASLTPSDDGTLRVRIPAPEGFAPGQRVPQGELTAQFDRIAAILREHPLAAAEVIGHTDSMGSELFNLRLSIERAEAVLEVLRNRGIELLRLSADGRGEAEPIADNGTPEGRATNRRVELILRPLY